MKRKRKQAPNAALIQTLIETAVKVCEEKGQLCARDLRQCQVEGNAQMVSHALHIAVQQGTLVKLGKRKGRFIYGLKPDKPEAIVTGLNWCGIAPFGHNVDNVAGGYRL